MNAVTGMVMIKYNFQFKKMLTQLSKTLIRTNQKILLFMLLYSEKLGLFRESLSREKFEIVDSQKFISRNFANFSIRESFSSKFRGNNFVSKFSSIRESLSKKIREFFTSRKFLRITYNI